MIEELVRQKITALNPFRGHQSKNQVLVRYERNSRNKEDICLDKLKDPTEMCDQLLRTKQDFGLDGILLVKDTKENHFLVHILQIKWEN